MKLVDIYTDGACSGNPGPGGWAAVLIYKDIKKELSGYEPLTTNNRMELTSVIMALENLHQSCTVRLHSDSSYVVNAFNNGWLINWQQNGWKKSDKSAVENVDLWQRLLSVADKHRISWLKVKGHSDDEYNNLCDKLARAQIDKFRKK